MSRWVFFPTFAGSRLVALHTKSLEESIMAGVQERVALVTGAGQGIGAAVAKRLAADGAKVGVLDLQQVAAQTVVDEITQVGGEALALHADVSDRGQVQTAVDQLVERFGSLHLLVNNAGVLRDNLLFKMSDDDWALVMNVHLRGAFLCSQIAQKHMVSAGYGRIVNMSSVSALGNRGQANYSTAKAGLQGLTKTTAIELGPFGITANAVAPGFIETAMTAATAERIGTTIEGMREQIAASIPVRRGGLPDDVANTVAFFAAEESGYVTGQVIYVDGGRGLI
jgi:3-oxoacyl-[acyl-carrier protein] reductase